MCAGNASLNAEAGDYSFRPEGGGPGSVLAGGRREIGVTSFQPAIIGYVTPCDAAMTFDVSDAPSPAAGEDTPSANGVLILPASVEREFDNSDESLGTLGRPFDHRSPFFIGLSGAFGVAVTYFVVRGLADISSILIIIGLALFIAIGLDPILVFLVRRGVGRGAAVGIVTLGFVLVVGAFVLAAVGPLSHEFQTIV